MADTGIDLELADEERVQHALGGADDGQRADLRVHAAQEPMGDGQLGQASAAPGDVALELAHGHPRVDRGARLSCR